MKKNIIFTLLLTALLGVGYTQAQNNGGKKKGQNKEAKGKENLSPEEKAKRNSERLEKKLSLTADQKTKVYDFALNRIQKVGVLKADTSKDKKAKGDAIKTIRDEYITNVNSVLTAEQKTKWEQMKAEAKARRQEKKKGDPKGPPAEEMEDDSDIDE